VAAEDSACFSRVVCFASLLDHLVGGREQLVRHGGYVDRILRGEKNTATPSSPLVTPGITSLVTPVPK
jgi:hypothetical protein